MSHRRLGKFRQAGSQRVPDGSIREVSQLAARFAELRETIELRRTRGVSAALDVVTTDRGKVQMDALRAQIDAMRAEERRLRMGRLQQMDSAYSTAMLSGILAAILGIGLTLAVGFLGSLLTMTGSGDLVKTPDFIQAMIL